MKERINITIDKELLDELRNLSKISNQSISGFFNAIAYLIIHSDILERIQSKDMAIFTEEKHRNDKS